MIEIQDLFTALGGKFLSNPEDIQKKYAEIKAIIFDWDGVFNHGIKFGKDGSPFSEPDSMGTNLMRFNYYMQHHRLLKTFIITGLNNVSASNYAEREHFDGIYLNYKHKEEALDLICRDHGITPDEIAFVFDDVLDLGTAQACLLSFYIHRQASPLTEKFVIENNICDYVTGLEGGNHAVREVCELLMGLSGNFNETIEKRIQFKGAFTEYFETRQKVITKVKTFS